MKIHLNTYMPFSGLQIYLITFSFSPTDLSVSCEFINLSSNQIYFIDHNISKFWEALYCVCQGLPSQTVKNLPAMQETWVQSLSQEDPLEKGMAAHSSILAWRIPWTEEPGGLQSMRSQRVRQDRATNTNYLVLVTQWYERLGILLFFKN